MPCKFMAAGEISSEPRRHSAPAACSVAQGLDIAPMGKSTSFKILRIGARAQSLGYIQAPNDQTAVKKWISEYKVSDRCERARIVARET